MHAYSLMYHDVVAPGAEDGSGFPGGDAAIYKLERAQFDDHLDSITRAVAGSGHERATTAAELVRRSPSRPPVVLLHFDDGGASALSTADRLERAGWRGWFHITTDRIGSPGFVTVRDVAELDQRGHAIGSHSCSHPARMSSLPFAGMVREWAESTARLSDIAGKRIAVASVPGGYSSRQVVLAAEQAGIELLFSSEPTSRFDWVRGCLVLGRYAIQRTTRAAEAAAVAIGARGPRIRQWAAWNGKKVLKRAGGTYWLALRKRVLASSYRP
jgi:peptidoglycan/xylan/chitin deacetylase (PgdA/CDA1 family)